MRTINVIACGPSAELWPGTGESIGVNDCEKTGKPVQKLVVVDYPLKFSVERFKVIQDSKAQFFSQLMAWEKYKPNMTPINTSRWRGYLEKNKVNHSSTSPFVAVSLAWNFGYQEIILWGVDMNDNRPYLQEERQNFKSLRDALWHDGVKLISGTKGGALTFLETL